MSGKSLSLIDSKWIVFLHLLKISVLSQILEECIKGILEELGRPIGVLVTDVGFGGSS